MNITSTLGGLDTHEFNYRESDMHLSYLPMAHIFERVLVYACLLKGGTMGMYNGDALKLKEDLADIKPTVFASVPRLYNRFYDLMKARLNALEGMKKSLADAGLNSKLENLKNSAAYTHSLYDPLLFNKTKEVFGGRVRIMITASAPISTDVLNFLKVACACPILEGYG